MSLLFTPAATLSFFGSEKLELVNSISVLPNGNIVVADGGNNAVRMFSPDGTPLKSVGGKGLGRYRLKEPVGAFAATDGRIFVADWHNHRVVVFNRELEYLSEFGHLGEPGVAARGLGRLKSVAATFASDGSYLQAHFAGAPGEATPPVRPPRKSLRRFLQGLLYFLWRHRGLRESLAYVNSGKYGINKPNGIAVSAGRIYVTQKNNHCVTVHDSRFPHAATEIWREPEPGIRFGRLGNIIADIAGNLFICDEPAGMIWKVNSQGNILARFQGKDSGTGKFAPFSCCILPGDLLCVCGGRNFQVIDVRTGKVLYVSGNIGELHGVDFDRDRSILYVADRLGGRILAYHLDLLET